MRIYSRFLAAVLLLRKSANKNFNPERIRRYAPHTPG